MGENQKEKIVTCARMVIKESGYCSVESNYYEKIQVLE